jgi:hypothetical protein
MCAYYGTWYTICDHTDIIKVYMYMAECHAFVRTSIKQLAANTLVMHTYISTLSLDIHIIFSLSLSLSLPPSPLSHITHTPHTHTLTQVTTITAEDFNVTPSLADRQWDYFPYVSNSPSACMEVYECPEFSLGIFLIKPNKAMPLHDHPGMHGIM